MRHFPARSGHGYPQGWFWKILSSSDIFVDVSFFACLLIVLISIWLTDKSARFSDFPVFGCPLFRSCLYQPFYSFFFHFLPVCLSVCLSVCRIDNFFIPVFLWCDKMEWSNYYIYFFSKKFISAKKMKILHSGRSNAKLVQFSNDGPVLGFSVLPITMLLNS